MNYKLYLLEFQGGVHFGNGSLDDSEIACMADTLFSALCHEAVKAGILSQWYQIVSDRRLILSDAFPYIGKKYYLPKPILWVDRGDASGNSSMKKKMKNLQFIDSDYFEQYFQGNYPEKHLNDMDRLGTFGMKVSAVIRGREEPLPYRVRYFSFSENAGLYVIVGYEHMDDLGLFEELLESLSFCGIGGKRSSGFGRFEYCPAVIPDSMKKRLEHTGTYEMLLSSALPRDEELDVCLEGACYELIRRGGFVSSPVYTGNPVRKKDLYVFRAGSCFKHPFMGSVRDVSVNGDRSVYRYACGMFMGVDI